MSDYPATPSYGGNYGSRDQTNPPYLPPTYPTQYMQPDDGRSAQGHMASNYDASMSAYAYNRALPAFSAAAVASGVPPLPIYQGWNQDAIPLPSYNQPQNTTAYHSYGSNTQNRSQYYPAVGNQSYITNAQPGKHYEQGELSEGEFEDGGVAVNTPPVGYNASQYGNGSTNYGDNMPHAGYSRGQDFNAQHSYPAQDYQYPQNPPAQLRRQQSDSYSPYVPSAVIDQDNQYNGDVHAAAPASQFVKQPESSSAIHNQNKPPLNGTAPSTKAVSQSNGNYHAQAGQHNTQSKASPATSTPTISHSVSNGKTVAESRKKAEAAILNLLPYDVRYQTYIDEGFREEIIGQLFDGLKMPRNAAKSSNSTLPRTASQQVLEASKIHVPTGPRAAAGSNAAKPQSVIETRKDKLELAIPSTSGTNAQPTQPAPKSAAMTEKERTLQSKMEALRKSREERAQKQAAAKDVGKPVEKPATAPAPVTKPELSKATASTSPTASESPSDQLSNSTPKLPIASNPIPTKSPAPSSTIAPEVRQHPSIPGLFLASNGGIPGLQLSVPTAPVPTVPATQKKRPVAADFDDATTIPAMPPFKRPFGHHRNDTPLVIDVSDDEADSEDEDIAMDLESAGDQDSPMQSEWKMSGNRSGAVPSFAQPFDRINKPFTPPPYSSANNTPPLPPSGPKAVHSSPAELAKQAKRRDLEIKELKKRIAEAEAKKRAKQTPSRGLTPQLPTAESSGPKDVANTNGSLASKIESSTKMQQLVTVAQSQVNSDQQKLADAQAAEAEKTAELLKNEMEQKRLLREKNANNQSLVDAEVVQTRTKLEELRAAMAEAEAAYQKSLEQKQKLKEEAERLEQEAELQAKRDRLEDLTSQKPSDVNDHPPCPSQAGEISNHPSVSTPEEPQQDNDKTSTPPSRLPGPVANSAPPPNNVDQAKNLPNGIEAFSNTQIPPAETLDKGDAVDSNTPTDQALEAALQEAVRADADSHAPEEGEFDEEIEMDMDIEDSYAPDPNQPAPESISSAVLENEGSPEYSPVLHRNIPESLDHDGDDYEPPEAVEPAEPPTVDSPPFSPAPPESVAEPDVHMSMATPPRNPTPAEPIPEPTAQEVDRVNSPQASNDNENGQSGAGELLPSVIGSSPKLAELGFEAASKTPKYTPYESPLKRFRAYRFHPEFNRNVAGGLRSKTYSHKIDANKEFCYWELTGGTCSDATCDQQHFKDIVLQDDAVLTALGSPEEFKDEQRDKFCEGLREVLMGLRVRKIRDFDIIASEIVAHRTKFLGDKSKVLALEGITI